MKFRLLALPFLLMLAIGASANDPADSTEILMKAMIHLQDSISQSLKYSTGKITPPGGHIVLNVPEGFKYLGKDQSKYVLTKLWGNPESAADEVVGMIFPKDSDPFSDSSYAFVVTYEEIGYVKDEDAGKINYDDLLKSVQSEEKKENEERVKGGYPTIHLVGWAQKPYYDAQHKVLHWAKELEFGDDSVHTLNYEVRILGRKGMVSLNAVGKMYDLPIVNRDISKVLSIASFTDGNSYFDFDPKVDNVAAWTIGGLVAGKLLAKAGFFALAAKFLAPLWKFIVLGFVGFGAWIKRKLGLKKKEENIQEYSYPAEPEEQAGEAKEGEGTGLPAPGEGTSAGGASAVGAPGEGTPREGTSVGEASAVGTSTVVSPAEGQGVDVAHGVGNGAESATSAAALSGENGGTVTGSDAATVVPGQDGQVHAGPAAQVEKGPADTPKPHQEGG